MLVLTRKAEESIRIGDDVTVTILSIDGERVRIGIDAPRSVRIYREELLAQTRDVNQEAVAIPAMSNDLLQQALRKTAEAVSAAVEAVPDAEPPAAEPEPDETAEANEPLENPS